jgi:HD-GYP domain-containing protein (c-di-GMP phosphodiesterase class II)
VTVKGEEGRADSVHVADVLAESRLLDMERVEASRERLSLTLRGRDRWASFIGAVGLLVVATLGAFVASPRMPGIAPLLGLVLAYAVASRVEFEVGAGSAIPTQVIFVPMLFLLPAGAVPMCVAVGLVLGSLPEVLDGRMPASRLSVVVFSAWHAVAPAAVVMAAGEPSPSWSSWPLVVAAVCSQFAVDFLVSVARGALVLGIRPLEQLQALSLVYLVDAALTPVGFALAIAAAGEPLTVLAAVPLVGLLAVFARERERRIDHALELSRAYRGTAFVLGDVIEANDTYTGSHSREVVELSLAVADELQLSPDEVRDVELAALLHDVGKITIPSSIITKAGPLTPDEWEVMKTHTIEGQRILSHVGGLLERVGTIVRACHENWDGSGYPDGLAGEAIPRAARIVSCCDAFNAMTTDRPYRRALSPQVALDTIRREGGRQFDPQVVAALAATVKLDARRVGTPTRTLGLPPERRLV